MAVVTSSKFNWVNVVTGLASTHDASVRPGQKGSLTTKCRGELLTMLGHYGWIKAHQHIDHPDASKHGGRIYVNKKDFRARSEPQAGDEVVFCVYADESGLGAEDCYVVGEGQFVEDELQHCQWINTRPYEADDDMSSDEEDDDFSMNPKADEFVPSAVLDFTPHMPQTMFDCTPNVTPVQAGAVAFNMSYFDDSDSESEFDMPCKSTKATSRFDDRSTQASDSSDSETDLLVAKFPTMMPPGLGALSLPPGLEPPPGLEFPSDALSLHPMTPPPGLELTPEEMLLNRLQLLA